MWPVPGLETNHWRYNGPTETYQTKLGNNRPWKVVRKTADETVNNSTTYQNDDDLSFTVPASTTWIIRLSLLVNTSAVADFKVQITGPAGSTIYGRFVGYIASGALDELTGASLAGMNGTGAAKLQTMDFLVIIGATSGTVQVQWAQNTAEVSDTKVLKDSALLAVQVA